MFSKDLMEFLMNYQKEEAPKKLSKKEIYFKSTKNGRFAEIVLTVQK